MRSLKERFDDIREDPVKLKRVFTVIIAVSYAMLMLGAFIIIGVLIADRL